MCFLLNYLIISLFNNIFFTLKYINFTAKDCLEVEGFKYSSR